MGRIASRGKSRWGRLAAILALAAAATLQGIGSARDAGGTAPQLPYLAYPSDDRLTLAGRLVRPEAEIRQEERIRAEMARVAASQNYQPHPAIWRISDRDTTIYLFGTVHSLPPGFRWRNPGLEAVVVRADSLLLESVDDANSKVSFLDGISKEAAGAMPPLLDRVSHRYRAKLAQIQSLLPPEAIKEMDSEPTWLAAMGVGFVRDLMMGDMPGQGADDWLEQHFRAIGRPVEAIENSHNVVAKINSVPEAAQRMMLEAALAAPDRTHAELDAPAQAWAQGQVGIDSPLMIQRTDLDPSGALNDPLLAERNAAWVEYLLGRLRQGPRHDPVRGGRGAFRRAGIGDRPAPEAWRFVERVQ
ncbi:MAG: TraB/GumN family protein [Sphingomonas sp.]